MFDKASGSFRHKNETPVQLTLAGQETIEVVLFTVNGERLSDVLNDPRSFIPVRTASGEILIVAKTQIAAIVEAANSKSSEKRTDAVANKSNSFDPYQTLQISPDASLEEVRTAYRARIKAVHPDTVASLDLNEDLSKAASQATQKIIYAYRKIMRERKTSETVTDKGTVEATA